MTFINSLKAKVKEHAAVRRLLPDKVRSTVRPEGSLGRAALKLWSSIEHARPKPASTSCDGNSSLTLAAQNVPINGAGIEHTKTLAWEADEPAHPQQGEGGSSLRDKYIHRDPVETLSSMDTIAEPLTQGPDSEA